MKIWDWKWKRWKHEDCVEHARYANMKTIHEKLCARLPVGSLFLCLRFRLTPLVVVPLVVSSLVLAYSLVFVFSCLGFSCHHRLLSPLVDSPPGLRSWLLFSSSSLASSCLHLLLSDLLLFGLLLSCPLVPGLLLSCFFWSLRVMFTLVLSRRACLLLSVFSCPT